MKREMLFQIPGAVLRTVRGLIYFLYYRLPKQPKMMASRFNGSRVPAMVTIGDISYVLQVHPQHGGIDEDIYLNGIREYPNVLEFRSFLEKRVKHLQTFIGIGANIGFYAIYADRIIRKAGKRIRIFSVEPVQATFRQLLGNIELNNADMITPFNVAVGDRDGKASMISETQKNLSRVSSVTPGDTGALETVSMVRLATLLRMIKAKPEHIVFRWDIEGFEYELVKGNLAVFKRMKDAAVIMEFHPFYLGTEKTDEFLRLFESAGFQLDKVVGCEPLYFVSLPERVRTYAKSAFTAEFRGPDLGVNRQIRSMSALRKEFSNPESYLYHYPNLHLYLHKT